MYSHVYNLKLVVPEMYSPKCTPKLGIFKPLVLVRPVQHTHIQGPSQYRPRYFAYPGLNGKYGIFDAKGSIFRPADVLEGFLRAVWFHEQKICQHHFRYLPLSTLAPTHSAFSLQHKPECETRDGLHTDLKSNRFKQNSALTKLNCLWLTTYEDAGKVQNEL